MRFVAFKPFSGYGFIIKIDKANASSPTKVQGWTKLVPGNGELPGKGNVPYLVKKILNSVKIV